MGGNGKRAGSRKKETRNRSPPSRKLRDWAKIRRCPFAKTRYYSENGPAILKRVDSFRKILKEISLEGRSSVPVDIKEKEELPRDEKNSNIVKREACAPRHKNALRREGEMDEHKKKAGKGGRISGRKNSPRKDRKQKGGG